MGSGVSCLKLMPLLCSILEQAGLGLSFPSCTDKSMPVKNLSWPEILISE